jgi:putative addiction module component (TIGR02574 family)
MPKIRKLLYEEEWNIEIRRRADEIDSGAVKTIPWEQVKAELRSLLSEAKDEKPPKR